MLDKEKILPVIVYSRRKLDKIRSCITENYGKIKYEFPFINAICVEMPQVKIDAIKHHTDVVHMCLDSKVSKLPCERSCGKYFEEKSSLFFDIDSFSPVARDVIKDSAFANKLKEEASSKQAVFRGASQGNAAAKKSVFSKGSQGENVAIAIIDTGITPHYDFVKPTNRIVAFKDFIGNGLLPYDDDGHGTHVAGVAAGNGYVFGGPPVVEDLKERKPHLNNIRYCMGSAPFANIVALKALDGSGSGTTSSILAAMQWISEHHKLYNIKVVNLSLGIDASSFNMESAGNTSVIDPLVLGSNALVSQGITVVSAAGNSGPKPNTITSPGTGHMILTVGATDSKNRVPDFSSRGSDLASTHSKALIKPDLVALGTDILSCNNSHPKTYVSQSGTSMAAPFVSGVVACLYSANSKLTPMAIKRHLMRTARPLENVPVNAQGAGVISN